MCRPNDRHRNLNFWLVLVLLFCLIATPAFTSSRAAVQPGKSFPSVKRAEQAAPVATDSSSTAAAEAYGKVPLYFEANHGQTDQRVNFITRANGATVFLTNTEAVFVISAQQENASTTPRDAAGAMSTHATTPAQTPRQLSVLRMKIEGANAQSEVTGLEQQPGIVNYFVGSDPAKWHANIPTFARVQYASVYPGVDLVYYGNQQQMEYDFVVKPGADASRIALNFEGANSLAIDAAGDLLIQTGAGTVRQPRPLVYQEVNGSRLAVNSGYQLRGGGRVGFSLAAYDRAKPLIIDPVLIYSTYLGGSDNDQGRDIAVDTAGNAYVTGVTDSLNFPTTSPIQPSNAGSDLFVTKINAAGSALVYSTYLGGSDQESSHGIAVDSAGNAFVTGNTASNNFPTVNPIQLANGGGGTDVFVTKINAAGSALLYSTYLGGGDFDSGNDIAVDSAGNAYVTGDTASTNFPTANSIQPFYGGGPRDAFVTKFNAPGSALVYSTYLGGNGGFVNSSSENGGGIAVDSAGNAYVTGLTTSLNFPTTSPIQPAIGGGIDSYVTKINAAGSAHVYSTYLGGGDDEIGGGIAVDSAGNACVAGATLSTNFPTANPIQPSNGGSSDAYVTKINAAGSALVYSTYLGGGGEDIGTDIDLDSAGNAYVIGDTDSSNFPTVNPIQPVNNGSDAFVTKINAAGSARVYSTYLGGDGDQDNASGIAVDSAGNAYVAGSTDSSNFPTTNPIQPSYGGGGRDAFITKLGNLIISGRVTDSEANGLAGIAVLLNGTDAAFAQTDANGNFQFAIPNPGGDYIVTPGEQGFVFSPESVSITNLTANRQLLFIGSGPPSAVAGVQFEFDNYIAAEDCSSFDIAVTRNGDTSGAATIDYATADGTAKQKGDYGITLGTISFAPGESNKIITVLITEDEFVEGDEQFTLNLFSPTGGVALAEPSRTTVTITDDDTTATNVNPIDDTEAFVCQHYHDFLNREPDTAGELFWINNIESCGTDAACRELKRTDTSAAFFLSIEFQGTGFYAIRLQRTAFGKRSDTAATRMTYEELVGDARQLGEGVIVGQPGADTKLAQNKQAYATQVVTSAAFIDRFPTAQTAAQYVDALYASAEVTPTATERTDAITAFGGGGTAGRVAALRSVVESQSIINAEVNPAFVLLQYHGYLRRNPTDLPDTDDSGYQFWLTKLNSFSGDFRKADMVKAFITSAEYRQRFGEP
jgi:hypothetical protein